VNRSIIIILTLAATAGVAFGQTDDGAAASPAADSSLTNPLRVIDDASQALPGLTPGLSPRPEPAPASPTSSATRDGGGNLSSTLSVLMLLSVLSLAPAILVMCTSFTRIVVVLALLRQAIGTQSLPPSQVVVGLSLFLTFLVMAPTFEQVNDNALEPLQAGTIGHDVAWAEAKKPIRAFMFDQIDHAGNWSAVEMMLEYRGVDTPTEQLTYDDVDMLTLVPAFMLSELKVAFLMGFRLYLPFLVIDMVIASVLISMGMLMLPPVLISLPFKLLLFVLVDGWELVVGNLLNSFAIPGVTT